MSFESLKNTPNISETLKDFAEKQNIELNTQELISYGKKVLSEKQKELISKGESSISEIMKSTDQLKELSDEFNASRIESAQKKSAEINNRGNLETQKSSQEAEGLLEGLNNESKISDSISTLKKSSGEVQKKVEQKVEEMGVDTFFDKIGDKVGGFIGEIFAMFGKLSEWFKGILGFGKIKEELAQKTKEVISPELRKKNLEFINKKTPELSKNIQESLNIHHPILDEKLAQILQNPELVSQQDLSKIVEKIQAGETLDLTFLQSSLGENYSKAFDNLKNDPEIKEALLSKFQKQLTDKIAEEYGFSLNFDKKQELANIIKKFENDFAFSDLLEKFASGETVYIGEVMSSMFQDGGKAMEFNWELISNGIIGVSNLTFHLVEGANNLIQFGLAGFGFQGEVTLDTFLEQVDGMSEGEKALFLAVMYRKGGIAFDLLGKITGFVAKVGLESISPATLSMVDEYKNFIGKTDSQIKSYQKLHNILGQGDDIFIKHTSEALKHISTQTEVGNLLNKAQELNYNNTDIINHLDQLSSKNMVDTSYLQSIKNILQNKSGELDYKKLRHEIVELPGFKVIDFQSGNIKGTLLPGKHQFTKEVSHSIKTLSDFQSKRILQGTGIQRLSKISHGFRSSFEQLQLSQKVDKLVFETGNLSEVNKTFKELKRFATQFPDQAKLSLGAIGEVALLGIGIATLQEDESTWSEICESLGYMTGIFGSGAMMFSLGGAYDKETGDIDIVNASLGTVGTGLFLYDMTRATKTVFLHGLKEGSKKVVGDIVFRPITNLAKGGIATGKFAINAARATPEAIGLLGNVSKEIIKNGINWQKISASMLSKMKGAKGRVGIFLGLTAAVATGTAMAMENDISEEYQEMLDKKIIDEKGNIINKQKAQQFFHDEFNEDEKNMFIELILNNNNLIQVGTHVNIENIQDGVITLKSHNKSIEKWCIEPSQKDLLEKFGYTILFV